MLYLEFTLRKLVLKTKIVLLCNHLHIPSKIQTSVFPYVILTAGSGIK